MISLPVYHVPGNPGDAGFVHGRALKPMLQPAFVEAYLTRLAAVIRFERSDLGQQAAAWLDRLPVQYQEEIAGMGGGAGVPTLAVAEFLFADIARSSGPAGDSSGGEYPELTISGGPMCSTVVTGLEDGAVWLGRNCDWLVATLMRGTAAVVHATPHRIPVLAVGIRGDIDVDTGINAERLWLHLHTLHAVDDPPHDRTSISWLFWAREALETCSSLDELERFIESTGRDRGVFAIAADGKTGDAAIFECSRAGHVRHDVDPSSPACVTNHTLSREVDEPRGRRGRPGGTIGRYHALRTRTAERPPRNGPADVIDLLAAPDVEMRTPRSLRTIYSAVVSPAMDRLWFAAGGADGTPAASGGSWARLRLPW